MSRLRIALLLGNGLLATTGAIAPAVTGATLTTLVDGVLQVQLPAGTSELTVG